MMSLLLEIHWRSIGLWRTNWATITWDALAAMTPKITLLRQESLRKRSGPHVLGSSQRTRSRQAGG
eukprot:9178412-Karenia_brevis.AAC.1